MLCVADVCYMYWLKTFTFGWPLLICTCTTGEIHDAVTCVRRAFVLWEIEIPGSVTQCRSRIQRAPAHTWSRTLVMSPAAWYKSCAFGT